MNLRNITTSVCITTSVLLSFSFSVHAVTYSLGGGLRTAGVTNEGTFTNQSGATTIDFNSGTPVAPNSGFAKYSGTYTTPQFIATDTNGQYAPLGPSGERNTSRYLSAINSESIIIDFSSAIQYFGLNWGSAQQFNLVTFNNKTGSTVTSKGSFGGAIVGAPDNNPNPTISNYVNFFANQTEQVNQVVLTSGSYAFQSDNHAYTAVPWEPFPTLDLLGLGALGGVIWLKRRRKNNTKLLEQNLVK